MADERLVTEIVVDAQAALAGIQSFVTAADRVVSASTAATQRVDTLSAAYDRMGSAATRAAATMDQIARAGETSSRAYVAQIAEQEAALVRLTARHNEVLAAAERLRTGQASFSTIMRESGNIFGGGPRGGAAPSFAPSFSSGAAVASSDIAAINTAVLNDLAPSGRYVAQKRMLAASAVQAEDPSTLRQHVQQAEAAAAAGGVTAFAPGGAGGFSGFGPSSLDPIRAPMVELAAAIERLRLTIETQAVRTAERGAVKAAEGAEVATVHAMTPAAVQQVAAAVPKPRVSAEDFLLGSVNGPQKPPMSAEEFLLQEGVQFAGVTHAPTPAAQPRQSFLSMFRRQGPQQSNEEFLLNSSAVNTEKSAASEAAAEVEKLGEAHIHAGGKAARMREALVLVHEFLRGDYKRAVGSATIELGNFGVLGYVFNPITLGLTAAAGLFAAVALRVHSVNEEMRQLGVITSALGTGTPESGHALIEQLRNTGSSAEDATKSVQTLFRSTDVGQQFQSQIANVARDISAVQGGNPAEWVGKLVEAFSGGVESTTKLGFSLKALSADEAAQMRVMAQHGDIIGVTRLALDAFSQTYGGSFERSLSAGANAMAELGKAWRGFLDALADTGAFKTAEAALTHLLQAMSTPGGARTAIGGVGGLVGGALVGTAVGGFPLGTGAGAIIGGGLGAAGGSLSGVETPGWVETILNGLRQGMEAVRLPSPAPAEQAAQKTSDAAGQLSDAATQLKNAAGELQGTGRPITTPSEAAISHTVEIGQATSAREALIRSVIQQESSGQPGRVSSAGAIGLMGIMPGTGRSVAGVEPSQLYNADVNQMVGTAYLGQMIQQFGTLRAGLTAYNFGPGNYQTYLEGKKSLSAEAAAYAPSVLSRVPQLTGNETAAQLGLTGRPEGPTAPRPQDVDATNKMTEARQRELEVARQVGIMQQALAAQQAAEQQARDAGREGTAVETAGLIARNAVLQKAAAEGAANHTIEQQKINDNLAVAKAYGTNAVAAGQLQAQQQANIDSTLRGVDATTRYHEILDAAATAALASANEQLKAGQDQIAAQEAVAAAALKGRDAEQQAKIATEAYLQTRTLLIAAQRSGSQAYIDEAEKVRQSTADQIRARETAAQTIGLGEQLQGRRDELAITQLQIGLQGENTREIASQTELARRALDINERFPLASREWKVEAIGVDEAIQRAQDQLAQAQLHTQALNEGFRAIAGTIEQALIEPMRHFLEMTGPQLAEQTRHHWAILRTEVRAVAAEGVTSITNQAFIRPALATGAQALGLNQAAQSLGGGWLPLAGSGVSIKPEDLQKWAELVTGANQPLVGALGDTVKATTDLTSAIRGAGGATPIAAAGQGSIGQVNIGTVQNQAAGAGLVSGTNGTQVATGSTFNINATGGGAAAATGALGSVVIPGVDIPETGIPGSSAGSPGQPLVVTIAQGGGGAAVSGGIGTAAGATSLGAIGSEISSGVSTALRTSAEQASGKPAASPFSVGNVLQFGSLANTIASNSSSAGFLPDWLSSANGSGGLFSGGGISDLVDNLGSNLGFASSSIQDFTGGINGAGEAIDSLTNASGGLFGATSLMSALGGAGAGFGVGSLINSLVGGNQLTGTIGSAGGSIAGALLGSIVPGIGTLLGGLFGGGAGGLLGGILGPPPPGQSAGANIGPGGTLSFGTAGASAQNIQGVQGVASAIGQFQQQLGQLTDATGKPIGQIAPGSLVVTQDNKQGIRVLSTQAGQNNAPGGAVYGQDAQNAVLQTELNLIHGLQGTSGVMAQVLQSITNPDQLQGGVQFANSLQQIETALAKIGTSTGQVLDFGQAFDAIFKGLATGETTIGPFQQALAQLNSTFSTLISTAQQFGQATSTLQSAQSIAQAQLFADFQSSVTGALQAAETGGNNFITSLLGIDQTYKQATSDLQYLSQNLPGGASLTAQFGGQITATAAAQAGPVLAGLSADQLQQVATIIGGQAPEISNQAQSLLSSGNALPDLVTQMIQAITDPVGLAVEKEKALGTERVQVAAETGQNLVAVEQLNADSIQQIWYQATQQLTDLKNQITGGQLSGLTAANQIAPAIQYFNQILALVQGGNTNLFSQLTAAGQAAINAAQSAYGNAPITQQVRQQVLGAISPLAAAPPGANGTVPSLGPGVGGVTAVSAAYPAYPTAAALSGSLSAAISGSASGSDYLNIAQAVQSGIISPVNQPQYATAITLAQQYVSGQAAGLASGQPSPLLQALQDAQASQATQQEWALINQAVNSGLLNPQQFPQYAQVINAARTIANAQAQTLSGTPNPVTAYNTLIGGIPSFAGGSSSTPPGLILVGEEGPELMLQSGGAQILPFPETAAALARNMGNRSFASGTSGPRSTALPALATGTRPAAGGDADTAAMLGDLREVLGKILDAQDATRQQIYAAQMQAAGDAQKGNKHLGQIAQNVGPNISAPARRAVG